MSPVKIGQTLRPVSFTYVIFLFPSFFFSLPLFFHIDVRETRRDIRFANIAVLYRIIEQIKHPGEKLVARCLRTTEFVASRGLEKETVLKINGERYKNRTADIFAANGIMKEMWGDDSVRFE